MTTTNSKKMKYKKKTPFVKEFALNNGAFGNILLPIMLVFCFFVNEILFKALHITQSPYNWYSLFLSFAFAIGITVFSTFFQNTKINLIVSIVLTGLLSLYYCVELIFIKFFGFFLTFSDLGESGQVAEFWQTILLLILRNILAILVFWTPVILLIIFGRSALKVKKTTLGAKIVFIVLALIVQSVTVGIIVSKKNADGTTYGTDGYYYKETYSQEEVANRFGVLTMARLDLKYCFVDVPDGDLDSSLDDPKDPSDIGTNEDPDEKKNYSSDTVIDKNKDIFWHTSPIYENTDKSVIVEPNTVTDSEFVEDIKENNNGTQPTMIDSGADNIVLYEISGEDSVKYYALYRLDESEYQILRVIIPEGYSGEVSTLQYEYSFTSLKKSEIQYGYNVIDEIDFDAIIGAETNSNYLKLHKYFSSLTPTKKNEYTGIFEGKNLIYMTCESFSPAIIDKDRTPTLYKMYTEGFRFSNYYVTDWAASTGGGEFSMATGLCALKTMNDMGTQLMQASAKRGTYFPFTLGNIFGKAGYTAKSYHNHNKNLYEREKSHSLWGFDYKYITKGLEMTYRWPCSDKEMIDASIGDYIDETPFVVDYMTISGHGSYDAWTYIAKKNKSIVENLKFSDPIKVYLAASMELEYAMQTLVAELEAKGILEDTVIVMAPDHWPYCLSEEYGVTNAQLNEFYGFVTDSTFERYHNGLIIWSASMEEPVDVSKPCTSIDILPTVLNLFGMKYDSRLIIGQDILSDSEGIAITKHNMSWVTDKGKYNASTGNFVPHSSDIQVENGYAAAIHQKVKNKVNYSQYIILYDYYKVLFEKAGLK